MCTEKKCHESVYFIIPAKIAKIRCTFGLFRAGQTNDCLVHGKKSLFRVCSSRSHLTYFYFNRSDHSFNLCKHRKKFSYTQ